MQGKYAYSVSKNNLYGELINNHLIKISFSSSETVNFGGTGTQPMAWATTLWRQVCLFETYLQPFLDEDYFDRKKKIEIPRITVVTTPNNLIVFTTKVYELLGLLMIYAYSNRLIKMDMMDKGDLEIIEGNEDGFEDTFEGGL